ncbi:MmgE/PrpD family protein, partial [Agrobacterium vitis]
MAISATAQLAGFISNTRKLPPPVSEKAMLHIADTLACIFAGSASQAAALLMRICARPDETAKIIVPGLGRWNDPAIAAMLIGVCAHAGLARKKWRANASSGCELERDALELN